MLFMVGNLGKIQPMNEMYNMSIGIHDFGVFALMAIIGINMVMLHLATDMARYAKKMRVFMPFSASMITVIIFTGAVMMAAKHLSFTLENIIMILFSIILIVSESKRYFSLKHIKRNKDNTFEGYKAKAMNIMGAELLFSLIIAGWMLI